jgi:glycosyltransferase involved in cell wall biosynthesis
MLWYENSPLSICEALATGCPVIASDVRNVSELLGQGAAGVLFERGNAVELARVVEIANRDDELMQRAGRAGRALYEAHYTAGANYRALLDIYHDAASTARVSA